MIPSIPMTQGALGGLGPWELGILLVIVLIVFGAGKLPGIGSAIGQAIKNFKKAIQGKSEDKEEKK
jgi:sec-independent protein translocase protein TatA